MKEILLVVFIFLSTIKFSISQILFHSIINSCGTSFSTSEIHLNISVAEYDVAKYSSPVILYQGFLQPRVLNPGIGIEEPLQQQLTFFPNPVTDYLTVCCNENQPLSFLIYDFLGQKIRQGSIENNAIYLNNLKEGLYFIEFTREGKKIAAIKIFKL